ncbi:hypothetical protein HRG_014080 [Hirsutella rhossiliensis]
MKPEMTKPYRVSNMVMLLPITLLWNVRIKWAKKLAFLGLFSLTVVTMIIATVRVADINSTKWETAIIVSCLSAFPQLFNQSARLSKPAFKPTDTYYQRLKASMRSKKRMNETRLDDLTNLTRTTDDCDHLRGSHVDVASHEHEGPLVPGSSKPVALCYSPPSNKAIRTDGGGIKQDLEYRVTYQLNSTVRDSEKHLPLLRFVKTNMVVRQKCRFTANMLPFLEEVLPFLEDGLLFSEDILRSAGGGVCAICPHPCAICPAIPGRIGPPN